MSDQFCEFCDVSKDLHSDPDEPDEADCESAGKKADLLSQFWGWGFR